ncbi:uncharacterized protein I303_102173 [Kwoniella dejecticola CBS 10117]|uniref:Uncharacterized protein n=1 Tax=Kwoniella dejecticola CBS 10117 TaxID=1296121 RepID=A0A1A6ABP0_9TREE|nr:uncharacterized protein I303_01687 [Kwoniella dejecticola CBS 10117]OBR87482.1 hypothetical protein I303_01687 [Kwoniella dejecticola CBS 10117]
MPPQDTFDRGKHPRKDDSAEKTDPKGQEESSVSADELIDRDIGERSSHALCKDWQLKINEVATKKATERAQGEDTPHFAMIAALFRGERVPYGQLIPALETLAQIRGALVREGQEIDALQVPSHLPEEAEMEVLEAELERCIRHWEEFGNGASSSDAGKTGGK